MNPFINQITSKDTIELMSRFFEAANNAIRRENYHANALEAFDLIQAISCYRYFPTVDECIQAFPTLTQDRHKVEYIWEQFGKLSLDQISDVYISAVQKLNLTDDLLS